MPVGQDYAAQKLLAELEERGVEVDLQYEHSPLTRRRAAAATGRTAMEKVDGNAFEGCTVSPSFDPEGGVIDPTISTSKVGAVKVEDMDPLRIFDTYMSQLSTNTTIETSSAASATLSSGADGGLTDEKIQAAVLEEGRRTIDRLLGSAGADGNALGDRVSVTGAGNGARVKDLRLENVSLSNFGPYGGDKAVQYPLSSRGLVLIRGQSTDGTGADSNGAGKVRKIFFCSFVHTRVLIDLFHCSNSALVLYFLCRQRWP